jgi:hypothetical protein
MKTSADAIINGDLAALGDASRHNLAALDANLHTTGVYRDDRPGVEARRNSLTEVRRHELALMPLTLSHIYSHRVARATAGAAALLCALGLLVILDDHLMVQLTAWFIPGFAVGMYALISVVTVLTSYVIATWVAEHKFAARMRELVTKGGDAYRDLDQLAVGPFAVAAEKVRRIDRLSVTLPLAGIAVLVPLLGFVGFVGAVAFTSRASFRSTIEAFMNMTHDLSPVLLALALGVVLALLLGRAIDRENRRGTATGWVRWAGHWSMLVIAFVLGIGVAVAAAYAAFRMQTYDIPPPHRTRFLLALGGEAVIMLPAVWGLLWWRQRERRRLGD